MDFARYITETGAKNLLQYKGGVTQDKGISYVYFISPLCDQLVKLLPTQLA